MSRSKRDGGGTGEAGAVGAFLRSLAARAEANAALAEQIAAALRESGLLPDDKAERTRETRTEKARGRKPDTDTARNSTSAAPVMAPDPFVVLRERGEAGLRAALEGMELGALRHIVRAHRLDPARISARWTTRERVVTLIVEQVRAQANSGKAFSRV
jgi:hypothetical protein